MRRAKMQTAMAHDASPSFDPARNLSADGHDDQKFVRSGEMSTRRTGKETRANGIARDVLLILGAPRSGTTWIGKIFDSHPDVVYRHEPDTLDRGDSLPDPVHPDNVDYWRTAAEDYADRLITMHVLKTSGQLPIFRKNTRSSLHHALFTFSLYALRCAALLPGGEARVKFARLPDLMSRPAQLAVIKSVSGCGRAGLFSAALPEARFVFVMRQPFAQVASMVHGVRMGLFNIRHSTDGLWVWPGAKAYGLTAESFAPLSDVEKLAWHWVLMNERALTDLQGEDRVRVVRYDDVRAAPIRHARSMFAFAGLRA